MGTIIKNTAIITDNGFSAIANATRAGLECLEGAGVSPDDVGLLINAGIFRDDNIMEPSIASLIQKELRMGLDFDANKPSQSTFSFDVVNGACGFLNAVNVADSFLKNGNVQYALILCGDAHPSKTDHPEFPYKAVGAAALLQFSPEANKGFQQFSYRSNCHDQVSSTSTYGDMIAFGDKGRGSVLFTFHNQYLNQFRQLNVELINSFLTEHSNPNIDFLLGSDPEPGFNNSVCQESSLANQATRALDLFNQFEGDIHTAAPIAGFHQLRQEMHNGNQQSLLFSSVGSGDASACALYYA